MARINLTKRENKAVEKLVEHYSINRPNCQLFLESVQGLLVHSDDLMPLVHSIKLRTKDPAHLRGKLVRKLRKAKEERTEFGITPDNLFEKINDLAGIRILHLYTRQFGKINSTLMRLFAEQRYGLREGPVAKTWDDESRRYFEELGVTCQSSKTLYTSVHYVIDSSSRTTYTCELQVRTLAEELWGEVDHQINYPDECESIACREQIAALARVTSSCSRLVDSIFTSLKENEELRTRDHRSPTRKGKRSA